MFTPALAHGLSSAPYSQASAETDPYALIEEVNALRLANGLSPFAINPILMTIAQGQASYMSVAGVSHNGPGGSTPWQRALAAGYPLAGDLTLGGFFSENITAGNNKSVQQAVSEWQGDAPHLNTMLSPNLTEIGAGVAIVNGYVYYVIDVARPTTSGIPQAYTPAAGTGTTNGITPPAQPIIVNTLLPATALDNGKIFHIVKPGETLWLIAISYGVKVAEIRQLNNMTDTEDIYPGEKIFIKQQGISTPLPATPTSTPPPTEHATSTSTDIPSPTVTPTVIPVIPFSSDSSTLVFGVIVAAAIVLAAVLVRAGIKR